MSNVPDGALHVGMLKKKSPKALFGGWQKRLVALTESNLLYYKYPRKEGDEPSGIIPLGSLANLSLSGSELKFVGLSKKGESREFIFKSDYARDVNKWKEAIMSQLQVTEKLGETDSSKEDVQAKESVESNSQVNTSDSIENIKMGEKARASSLDTTIKEEKTDENVPACDSDATENTQLGNNASVDTADSVQNSKVQSNDVCDANVTVEDHVGPQSTASQEQKEVKDEGAENELQEMNQVGGYHREEKPTPVPPLKRGGSIITRHEDFNINDGNNSRKKSEPTVPECKEVPPSPATALVNKWHQQRTQQDSAPASSKPAVSSKIASLAGRFQDNSAGDNERSKVIVSKKLYGADLVRFLEEQGISNKPKVIVKRKMKWEVNPDGRWIVNGEVSQQSKAGKLTVRSFFQFDLFMQDGTMSWIITIAIPSE